MAALGALFAWAVCACITAVPVAVAVWVLRRPLRWLWRAAGRGMAEAGPVYGWAWRVAVRAITRGDGQ